MTDVLIVQHSRTGGPGRLGEWLEAEGLKLEVVHAHAGEPLPARLDHAALVVLGGGYLPSDDERAPWLPATRSLVRQAIDTAVPYFGICLGGQMLAEVAGGEVRGNHGEPENGSTPVTFLADAAGDPLFHDAPAVVPAIEHHKDAITALPPGAAWLARSESCPYQALRVGERAWGVQFHPEVSPERIRGWEVDGFDPAEVYARAVADEPVSTPVWRAMAGRFARLVAE